jgi:hypothetical protein
LIFGGVTLLVSFILIVFIFRNFKGNNVFSANDFIKLKFTKVELGNFFTFFSGLILLFLVIYYFDYENFMFFLYLLLLSLFLITTVKVKKIQH